MENGRIRNGLVALFLIGLLGSCIDEGVDPTDEVHFFPPSCQEIVDACHEVDLGYGPLHECHETAHDVSTAEACEPIRDECVALCDAAASADADADGDADADADARGGDADALDTITLGQEDHVHDHGAGE